MPARTINLISLIRQISLILHLSCRPVPLMAGPALRKKTRLTSRSFIDRTPHSGMMLPTAFEKRSAMFPGGFHDRLERPVN